MARRAVIRVGDPTTHGGKVLEGDPRATARGRAIARKGHQTWCPQCKGNFPIREGSDRASFFGAGTALEGMATACGAKLIATTTRGFMEVDDGPGEAAHGTTTTPAGGQDEAADDAHAGAFRAVDAASGAPLHGLPYRIELPDGSVLRGSTDADGYTQRVTGHDPATVHLHWDDE